MSENKTFNFYCDESTHLENDKMPYMLISYVSCAFNEKELHSDFIKRLKEKHNFHGEIKWNKVSNSMAEFYLELVDYFFATDLLFRSVIIDKTKINNSKFGFTYDEFYFRMYYQLLHHRINMSYSYNVYLDMKDTSSGKKLKKLKEILNIKYGSIRQLQFIKSHESYLMQITDLLMGAINYNIRGENKVIAKNKIIERIKKHSNLSLDRSTIKAAEKFNLFFIDLN